MPVLDLTVADLTGLFLRLLPRGLVWPKSLSFVQPQVIQALMPTYQRLVARDNMLLVDAFPATADELLPEWEASVGLPDPCSGEDVTVAQRQAHVVARLIETDGPSIASLVGFAAALGYAIKVVEFTPSRFGQPFGRNFFGPAWASTWEIVVAGLTIRPFYFGIGVFGEPFRTWANSVLLCELDRLKPAHTALLLTYTTGSPATAGGFNPSGIGSLGAYGGYGSYGGSGAPPRAGGSGAAASGFGGAGGSAGAITFSGSSTMQSSGGTGAVLPLPIGGIYAQRSSSFDGYGRAARELLNNVGVCGGLVDATPAQYAAALEYTHIPLLRGNYVANNTSAIATMQAVREAQLAMGSIRPALFYCLVMAYLNDLTTFSAQQPLILAMLEANVLWGVAGPNEINNPGTGGGSRGPDDAVDKTATALFPANLADWAGALFSFKAANIGAFGNVFIAGANVAPETGTQAFDYPPNSLEGLADFWDFHYYAGHGYQPGLPYGLNPGIGYFGNNWSYAQQAYSPNNTLMGILSESGATTVGPPDYAKDGLSQAKYLLNQQLDAFKLNAHASISYELFDGDSASTTDVESCFGLFLSDGQTPKPAATAIARMQTIRSLNLDANDPANLVTADTGAFQAGVNMSRVVVTGLTDLATSDYGSLLPGVLAEYKSDGSTIIWLWNEATIDSGGTDSIPPVNLVTLDLPYPRPWRIHDPMGTVPITGPSSPAWTTGSAVPVPLQGYPLALELATPPAWTASGGDPLDVLGTGSPSFGVQNSAQNYAHNYAGTKPDDNLITVPPPAGGWAVTGNFAILILVCTENFFGPVNAAGPHNSTLIGRFQNPASYTTTNQTFGAAFGAPFATSSLVATNQVYVWSTEIVNLAQTFTTYGCGPFGQAHVYEVSPYSAIAASAMRGAVMYDGAVDPNGYESTGQSITGTLAAVPAGAIGLFFISQTLQDISGGTVMNSSDGTTTIVQQAPNDNTPNVDNTGTGPGSYQNNGPAGVSGIITAPRPAGAISWPSSNLESDSAAAPQIVTIVITH